VPRIRSDFNAEAPENPAAGATVPSPHAGLEDAALVAAARTDPRAFTTLYERYADRVHRYCYLKLGSREAAEDATSQVFLEALDDLGRYRGGYFAGWLFRIAQHTVTDTYRRRPSLPLVAAQQIVDPEPMPEQRAIAQGEIHALRAALQTLPTDQRAVLELQLADLSTQEIAQALDRSANAVRIIRYRAFQRLRTLLEPPHAAQQGGRS
jgi:RNA polymerase sigma-70 factor (ECF subfamily)